MRRMSCGCGQRILWARTVNNRPIALNPVPDPEGNQAVYRDGTGTWLTRQLRDGEEPYGYERRLMPHVATCPLEKERRARAKEARQPVPENVVPHSTFLARLRARGRR